MLLLSIFLHQKVKNNQNMIKEPSFGTPRGLLTCLLTLSLRTTPAGVFPGYFNFGYFLATSCCLYKKRLSSLKFTLNLASKKNNFLSSKCTSLVLHSKPVQRNCLHFFKKQCALKGLIQPFITVFHHVSRQLHLRILHQPELAILFMTLME